jgi:hypothetical protein
MFQEQRRGGHTKTGLRGLAQACTRPGCGRAPRGTSLARLARANSIDGEEDGAGVHSGIFPPQPPVSTLYKKGEAHTTQHTQHIPHSTSSRELLTPSPPLL